MSWEVIWLPDAEQELADASDRSTVTQAANLIDSQLRSNPENIGSPSRNSRRGLIVSPRAVIYRVIKDAHRVEVLHVWTVPGGNGRHP